MALARICRCGRSLGREPFKGLLCGVLQPGLIESCVGAKRHLLSEDIIKLQEFQQKKLAVAHLANGTKGNFFDLFKQKLEKKELILRDDLKLLFHLCQSADDMLIARDALYRYHTENHNLLPGDFKFGPLFMRLCYELGMEDLAFATVTDKNIKGFFSDATSFNIAIDMLFTKSSYIDALEVLRTMKDQGITFNKDTLILASGTCYKLNTLESYRICVSLIEEAQAKGNAIPRHAYCFAVALAIRQNDIERAHSLYSQILNTDGRLYQNLWVVLQIMSGKVEDAISTLSAALSSKSPLFIKRPEFSQEVIDILRLKSENGSLRMNVEQVVTQLEQSDQVTQQTLNDMLCYTPSGKRKPPPITIERRSSSRRTHKPLRSTLLSE